MLVANSDIDWMQMDECVTRVHGRYRFLHNAARIELKRACTCTASALLGAVMPIIPE